MIYYNYIKNFFKNFFHHSIKFYIYIILLVFFVVIFIQGFIEHSLAVEIDGNTYPDFDTLLATYISDTGVQTPFVNIIHDNTDSISLIFSQPKTGNYYPLFQGNRFLYCWKPRNYKLQNNQWVLFNNLANQETGANFQLYSSSIDNVLYNSSDVYNSSGVVVKTAMSLVPPVVYPEITTSSNDFINLSFDVLSINAHDFSNDDLYLLCYDKNFVGQDSFNNLYPVNEILLNTDSPYYNYQHSSENSYIYWIPRQQLGLKWYAMGTYSFRFAVRVPVESEFSDWAYDYLTEDITFTLSQNLNQSVLDQWNEDTQYYERNRQHEEIMAGFDSLLDDNPSSENEDGLNSILDIDNSNSSLKTINGEFFTRLGQLFSTFLDYDINEVENLSIPMPHSEQSINFPSDYLSRNVGNGLKTIIGMFWIYVFGMYVFKFLNNILISLENGDFIDPNKDPVGAVRGSVILTDML